MRFNCIVTSLLILEIGTAGGREEQWDLWTVLLVQVLPSGSLLNPTLKLRRRAGAVSDAPFNPAFPWVQLSCEITHFPNSLLSLSNQLHTTNFNPLPSFLLA